MGKPKLGKVKKGTETAELNEAPAKVEKAPKSERELNLESKVAEPEKPEDVGTGSGKDACDVIRGNEWIRRYSKKVHGDNFLEIAKEMVSKDSLRSIVPPVIAVRVEWREEKIDPETKMLLGYVQKEERFTDVERASVFKNTVLNGVVKVSR